MEEQKQGKRKPEEELTGRSTNIPKLSKFFVPLKTLSASIEEIPDKEEPVPSLIPTEDDDQFDTMHDVWHAPEVREISSYELGEGEFLVEYDTDGISMRIIEEVSMDTPLTRDGTSRLEQLPNYST